MLSVTKGNRKKTNILYSKLDTGQITCCPDHLTVFNVFFSVLVSVPVEALKHLLAPSLMFFSRNAWDARMVSCKYSVKYILSGFFFSLCVTCLAVISPSSSCLETQALCTVCDVIDLWHVHLFEFMPNVILSFSFAPNLSTNETKYNVEVSRNSKCLV